MGLLDPFLCEAVDVAASELLREQDPDPAEMMAMSMFGVPQPQGRPIEFGDF